MWGSHSQLESALKEKHLSRVRGPDDPPANRGKLQQKALPWAGLDTETRATLTRDSLTSTQAKRQNAALAVR